MADKKETLAGHQPAGKKNQFFNLEIFMIYFPLLDQHAMKSCFNLFPYQFNNSFRNWRVALSQLLFFRILNEAHSNF